MLTHHQLTRDAARSRPLPFASKTRVVRTKLGGPAAKRESLQELLEIRLRPGPTRWIHRAFPHAVAAATRGVSPSLSPMWWPIFHQKIWRREAAYSGGFAHGSRSGDHPRSAIERHDGRPGVAPLLEAGSPQATRGVPQRARDASCGCAAQVQEPGLPAERQQRCQEPKRDIGSQRPFLGYSARSTTRTFISSLFALSSGAYIAAAVAGRALNLPGISARRR